VSTAETAAFAIAIDSTTGDVSVVQYVSLHHNSPDAGDINEFDSLTGLVNAVVTVTDGDGDHVSATTDIGDQIHFHDDGPTAGISGSTTTIAVDESSGSQADEVPGPLTVFSGILNKGTDLPTAQFATKSGLVSGSGISTGADNEGATTVFSLSITGGNGTDSLLTTTDGHKIYLEIENGLVVGRIDGNNDGLVSTADTAAFAIAIDSTTGDVSLVQYVSLHHGSPDPGDISEADTLTGLVNAVVTVTDGDGDHVSATTDIGDQIQFLDDGPTAAISGTTTTVRVDESSGSQADEVPGPLTVFSGILNKGTDLPTAQFATKSGLVSAAGSSAGADNEGATTVFSLSITGGNGTDSLLTTTDGHKIYLEIENGLVVGRIDGNNDGLVSTAETAAFAIAIDSTTGDVSLVQYVSLHHGSPDPGDISEADTLTGLVNAVVTVTDGDGDHVSATTDIGDQIQFLDDGPTAPTVIPSGTVGVDETVGIQTIGGANDVLGSTAITFNGLANTVAGLFTSVANKGTDPDVLGASLDNGALSFASTGGSPIVVTSGGSFGADNEGGTTTYALVVTNSASGLTLTDGTAITLSLDGSGRVIGTVGTDVVNPSLTGKVAFAIAIDPLTGKLYVVEYLSLHQDSLSGTPNDAVSLAAGTVAVSVTLTDGDGDHVSGTADISAQVSFLDDGPANIISGMAVLTNTAGKSTTAVLDVDTNVDNNYGSDGGNTQFSSSLNGTDSGLTSGGQHIIYSISNGGHTLTGFIDGNSNGVLDVGETSVFTINLNLDGAIGTSNDTYTVNMIGTVDGGATTLTFSDTGFDFVGGNDPWAGFIQDGAANNDLLITPELNGLPDLTVNANATVGGVDTGNSVGAGEAVRLDFVHDLGGNPAKAGGSGDYSDAVNEDHTFTDHYTVNGATATFSSTTGSKVKIVAADDVNLDTVSGGTGNAIGPSEGNTGFTIDSITAILITYGGVSQLVDLSTYVLGVGQTVTVNGHDFVVTTIDANGAAVGTPIGVTVDNVVGDNIASPGAVATQIGTFTADGFSSIEYSYVSGDEFKIGQFSTVVTNVGQPVDFSVPLTITDGDGDTASGSLNVYLVPGSPTTQDHSADGVGGTFTVTLTTQPDIMGSTHDDTLNGDANANILAGNAGNDTINGNGGIDTLIGGPGDDTLDGGTGNDHFVLQAAGGGHDTIVTLEAGDDIFVDIGISLTFNTATILDASNFHSGDETVAATWNGGTGNEFVYNSTTQELWFSADGTGADKIDLAHISTGTPTAGTIHTF
jgi:hypothetical protein